MSRAPVQQPTDGPNPASAEGIMYSLIEGIALAILNTFFTLFFSELSSVQQSLNPESTFLDLSTFITIWGIAYFLFAYILPIAAAYAWADKAGIGVYFVGWMGTSLLLNQSFTLGMILLIVACLLVVVVDLMKNSKRKKRKRGRPPVR